MKTFALVAALIAAASAQQLPYDFFNFHYGFDTPNTGFYPQPRTVDEAVTDGFELLSSCGENPTWEGNRYGRPGQEDVVLIFDVNGFIAGMQSMVPEELCATQSTAGSSSWDCSATGWHQPGDFFGGNYYFITSYLVDVSTICTTGRTQEDLDAQGAGYTLLLQQSADPTDVMAIPQTQAEMDAQFGGLWYTHLCFPNMGIHYFTFNYDVNQDCQEVIPFQIIYDVAGNLNGVVHQHFSPVALQTTGSYYEAVNNAAAFGIVASPPQCLLDYTQNSEASALHMYFRDYHVSCP